MAHPPALPALGDYVAPNLILTGIDVDEIPDGAIPTDEQIVRECHRRKTFEKQSEVMPINAADAAAAEIRYNSVLMRRNNGGMVLVHPDLMAMFDPDLMAIFETLRDGQKEIKDRQQAQQLAHERLQVEVQEGHARLQRAIYDVNTKLDASIRANAARSVNRSIRYNQPDLAFGILPKIIAGHPFVDPPPNVPGVDFNNQVYQVGANPPNGLFPLNFREFGNMRIDVANSPSRLRGLFWFYNDPRLFIPNNATNERCSEGWDNFKRYIRK
ncbi:envelope glycoprotein B [Striga asiatica]|uniref:Envelope glycoprotein B n=1 Tax=Striga asiatica TaxID=4170 RepID=A0A5A7RFS6_STRAF|nr:envelope glycoprotein B [Striga asiatica]